MGWELGELKQQLRDNSDLARKNPELGVTSPVNGATPLREHKYHAVRTEYNGKSYPSKKEAQRAMDNDLRIKASDLSFYLEQVPMRLPGKITYRVDFVEFMQVANTELYEVHFIDTKGYDTPVSDLKRKQVESLYKIKVEVI